MKATAELIGNKISDKITKILETSSQTNLKAVKINQKIWNLIEKYLEKDIYL